MREILYYIHFSPWRRRLHNICNSKYFDLIINAIIGLNVVTMSLEFYLIQPIIALGTLRYFKDKWNQLDITIVILSIAGIILEKNE
ncbi:unnamed protein product [Rotaria sp. Silwood1]|nr:unnamed protein product [Rotaria sp. Silwood1]